MLSGVKMRSDVHQIIPNESGTSQSLLQPGVCGAKGDVAAVRANAVRSVSPARDVQRARRGRQSG